MEKIDLFINDLRNLYINSESLMQIKSELEEFIKFIPMNNLSFAKNVMLSEEIKSNNLVEGYLDDLKHIDEVVKSKDIESPKDQRILNLYKGYKYILKQKNINKESLKNLYSILSKNLLIAYDINHMGKYYRNDKVFIYNSSDISKEPDEGLPCNKIEEYMDYLFEYINSNNNLETQTDFYIKSQIMHFYFVYIHPYFDVNGRTSRTTSMWYLLNNEVYPYIIFNRGINFDKSTYYRAILEAKKYGNITIFLKYMLENVKIELEKEYLILNIESLTEKLSVQEKQTLNYILSMKQQRNLKTFNEFYSRFNDRRKLKEVNETLIEPLLEKNIIEKKGKTKGKIYNGNNNFRFEIKDSLMDKDENKIKRLVL